MNKFKPCSTRKNHYVNRDMARQAMLRQQEKFGWKMEVYECPECGEFHLSRTKYQGRPVPIIKVTPDTEEANA